jgi:8-oxo-dGTP pyrophosphatase MutT (NUDIX family)
MQATKISLDNAKQNKLFYFVANVVIYRESDGRCLIMKRDAREIAHPNKYAVAGGKLEWSDLPFDKPTRVHDGVMDYENKVEDLLVREAREESGVEIEPKLKYINSVAFIRPDETPVVMVKFAAKYKSGEVVLEEGAFTDYAWVNAEEVKQYDCILGIQEEVAETIRLFAQEAKIGV